MNSERQEALHNDLFAVPQRNLPPPVPPRSQPATGSLFTTAVPSPGSFVPRFPPVSSVPVASRFQPGFGLPTNPSFPPDPLLGGYSQASGFAPPVPPHAYMASDLGKRQGFPVSPQPYASLSGAYHQPPPHRVSPPMHLTSATPMNNKEAEKVTQLRIQHMEGLVSRLQKEKKAMDEEFGRQRKKFMNQMMQTESELILAKQSVANHAEQIENLNKALLEKGEEVTSLNQKLEEAGAQGSVAPESKFSLGLSGAKRRSRSPRSPFERRSPSPTSVTSVNFSSEHSLENQLVKAAEDTKLLRSVVVPLEEEIDLLKMKLSQAEERLSIYEGKESAKFISQASKTSPSSGSPSLAPQHLFLQSSPVATGEMPEMSGAALLQKMLSQEQVSRTDLERHVESLRLQKTALQKDFELMTAELRQVKEDLCKERVAYTSLRETWDKANIYFLSTGSHPKFVVKEITQHDSEMVDSPTPSPLSEGKEVGTVIPPSPWRRKKGQTLSWHEGLELAGKDGGGDGEMEGMWQAVVGQLQKSVMRLHSELESKAILCESYEKQMQRVQEQLLKEIEEKDFKLDKLNAERTKLEATILSDRKSRADTQRSLLAEMEDAKTKIESYQAQENKMRKKVKTMSEKFMETKHEVQKEVSKFSAERIRLQEQLDQVKEEYKCLKEVHVTESNEYRTRLSTEMQARQEAEMNLKAAMDKISNMELDREVAETSMANQLSEMQQQLSYARQERQRLESELGIAKTDLAGLLRDKSNLEAVKNEALDSQASVEEKSRLFIEQQQQKIEELVQQKESAEETIDSMRKQVSALKQQLHTSEANQRDFVELSQSLQVKLVEMEEAQQTQRLVKEVQQTENLIDGLSNSSSPSPPETATLLPL